MNNTEPSPLHPTADASHRDASYAAMMLGIICFGTGLRLFRISSQILLDDEWHGMYYAIGKGYAYLLTHFSVPGATCIPLNLYRAFLLNTIGWNELLLRFPSLTGGILSLILLPLMARSLFSRRVSLLFALFLGISPFLVFYSRFCRPYSLMAFLSALSLLSACRWLRGDGDRYGYLYAGTGALAVWTHLFAVGAVAAPILWAFCIRWTPMKRRIAGRTVPSLPDNSRLIGTALLLAALIALLVGPALIGSLTTTMPTLIGKDHMTWATLRGMAELLAGVHNPVLILAFCGVLLAGALLTAQHDLLTGGVLLTTVVLTGVTVRIASPHGMHSPIVVTRYCMALVPVAILLASLGLDALITRLQQYKRATDSGQQSALIPVGVGVALPAALFLAGPLPILYASQNNFMNHTAFQQSYAPLRWDQSYTRDMTPEDFPVDLTIHRTEISPFYGELARDLSTDTIIEYPMLVGDHFNPHYFYQHFHGKRVLIGFTTRLPMRKTPATGQHVYGNTYVDEVLGCVKKTTKLRFSNMVDLPDAATVIDSGAQYMILHKRFEAQLSRIYGRTPLLKPLIERYLKEFGKPAYEDSRIVVFRVPTNPKVPK